MNPKDLAVVQAELTEKSVLRQNEGFESRNTSIHPFPITNPCIKRIYNLERGIEVVQVSQLVETGQPSCGAG